MALDSLPPPLPGECFTVDGSIACWTAGSGRPLLLVHSINAAASAAEVRPVFEALAATRRVVAVELPGYGHSLRDAGPYTPRRMTDALQAVATELRRRWPGDGAPLDALAVSLGCEFLVRAAAEQPALWGRLALVSPTGFNGKRPRRGPPGSTRVVPWLQRLLTAPRWSQGLFDLLTRPAVVRYFLRRTWGGPNIDATMADHAVLTARQPGARHAPLQFLSGALFSADIHTVYEQLAQPVWVSHGVRGDFTDYRGLALVRDRANWRITRFDSGALPYFEHPAAFNAALLDFLG